MATDYWMKHEYFYNEIKKNHQNFCEYFQCIREKPFC